jgi:hypothetical protein
MAVIETHPKMDSKSTKAKVADWVVRLNNLYAQLDEWLQDHPNAVASRGEMKQVIDPLMKHYKIPSRVVPTYTVLVDKKWRVAFMPGALWTVGANGLIDISTNFRHHTVFDVGGKNGEPSDWQMSHPRKFVVPFDQAAFSRMLGERR